MVKRKKAPDINDESSKKECLDEYTVVKCSLKSVMKDPVIYAKIQQDVEEMSFLACEASLQINYELGKLLEMNLYNNEKINFRDYFYRLLKIKTHVPSSDYQALRNAFKLEFYNKSYRSNLFCGLAEQYIVNFENNIHIHAYSRVKKYLAKTNNLTISKSEQSCTKIYNGYLLQKRTII